MPESNNPKIVNYLRAKTYALGTGLEERSAYLTPVTCLK
jgi:hypothetical protein